MPRFDMTISFPPGAGGRPRASGSLVSEEQLFEVDLSRGRDYELDDRAHLGLRLAL